nr:YoaK family protein [uncultured Capnocytophaga sp.]
MFRHQGKSRTAKHNLQIAVVLSFVAGMVNVTGFLFVGKLTTNVTGHFAYFIYDVSVAEFWKGLIYFLYIFAFLIGSFTSGLLIENANYKRNHNKYLAPTLLECFALLMVVGLCFFFQEAIPADVTACILLFAMGLQNAFVTKISNSVVRTTHLTGLFTDLGIELAQLLYLNRNHYESQLTHIKNTIKLRLFIITFFFLGGFSAGYFYIAQGLSIYTLLISVGILLLGLFYDGLRFFYFTNKRHYETYNKRRKRRRALRRQSRYRRKQASGRHRAGRQDG